VTGERVRVLILGGTTEGAALAIHCATMPGVDIVSSLAGRVRELARPPGAVRVGGFGGTAGLAAYLEAERIDGVVDATHPFAARISAHAAQACAASRLPLLALVRPPWRAMSGDRWHDVADMSHAATLAPALGARVFLTVGRQELAPFAACADRWFLIRIIDAPTVPLPPQHTLLRARGPFAHDEEEALLRDHAVDVLVSKNSGGDATYPKIEAARNLGIPVVMVQRPPRPPVPYVESVAEAVAWIGTLRASPASVHV